jgi:hypothetical protein
LMYAVFQLSVDLDIENGSSAHYSTFINALRSLTKNARKRYFVLHCSIFDPFSSLG